MKYAVGGPFPIPLDEYNRIPRDLEDFWTDVKHKKFGSLRSGRGIYMFCTSSKGSKKLKPWYVGKTNKQAFDRECFSPYQRNHYCDVLSEYSSVKAYLFLVVRLTPKNRLSQSSVGEDVDFLEKYFIGAGLVVNGDLCNERDTKMYTDLIVPAFFNSGPGAPGVSANKLRATLTK